MVSVQRLARKWWASFIGSETAVLITTSILVGLGGGFGAVVFRWLIATFRQMAFGPVRESLSFLGRYSVVPIPALGGLLLGPMIYYLAREAKGHGVPEVMEAVALRGGRIRPIVAVVKALASSLCIGTGGSVGREGPIVQIGSALGSTMGQIFRFSDERIRNLVACGAAAGIAATFNAPIAGVFFALEIILGEFSVGYFSSVVLSSVMASVIGRIFFGDVPAFPIPPYAPAAPIELPLYAALGLLAAVVGVAFVRTLYGLEDIFDSWHFPEMFKPVAGGVLVGIVGAFFPQVFGVGYETIEQALYTRLPWTLLLILAFMKILATSITLGSGGSGGVFAPSLFIGAMLGGAYGLLVHSWMPGGTAAPGAYALVGMAAVFSAAARAPITAIVILFEMTRDYRIILPLMLATVISTVVASLIDRENIYTWKLKRRGVDLRAGKDVNLMKAIKVEDAMTPLSRLVTVTPDMPLRDLARLFDATHHHGFAVVNSAGELYGVVTLADLERAVNSGRLDGKVADICTTNVRVTFPDETLEDALRHFGALDVGRIPVVSRANPKRLVGLLRRSDIIRAYSRAALDLEEKRRHLELMRMQEEAGAKLMEFEVKEGYAAVGKKLKELNLPSDCLVVSIRRGGRIVVPRGETSLLAGDRIVILADSPDEEAILWTLRQGEVKKPEEIPAPIEY